MSNDFEFIKGFKEIGEIQGLADGIVNRDGSLTKEETITHAKRVSYLAQIVQEAMHNMHQKIMAKKNG